MASSVPAFGVPYNICRQACYLDLDDQCMADCDKEQSERKLKAASLFTSSAPKVKKWQAATACVAGAALAALGIGGILATQ